ncbi:MAG: A24 family peptidase [Anaerovoracaceae bacterium]
MDQLLRSIIIVAASIGVGVIAGNGAVYGFNRIPATWLCDYGKEPDEAVLSPHSQRIKSYPWKYVFVASFIVIDIYLGMKNWQYAIGATFALWLLLELAIATKKYKVISQELVLFLAITAFGFIPFHSQYLQLLWGALIGFGGMILLGLAGKLIRKKEGLLLGSAKLCGALGLMLGPKGIGFVLIFGVFLAGIGAAMGLLKKKQKKIVQYPLALYIEAAAGICIVLFFPLK